MSAPDHNVFDNEGYYDLGQWTDLCGTCLKTVSSSRPPVYNPDNCSCADLGSFTHGTTQVPQPAASPGQGFQYKHNDAAYYPPQSYASSTASVPCPEGVEREDPNLHIDNNHYLPVAPEMGLNEVQHRRTASVHSDMSYQMRRFLVDQRDNQPRQDISPQTKGNFLPQDTYIQSQATKKPKKDRKSKPSYQSFGSSVSEEYGFVFGADAMAHVGEWVDERIRFGDGRGYEMSLSGMTDELNGE
jgi:hypothetical protein